MNEKAKYLFVDVINTMENYEKCNHNRNYDYDL